MADVTDNAKEEAHLMNFSRRIAIVSIVQEVLSITVFPNEMLIDPKRTVRAHCNVSVRFAQSVDLALTAQSGQSKKFVQRAQCAKSTLLEERGQ